VLLAHVPDVIVPTPLPVPENVTFPDADIVVNAPDPAAVPPIAPGDANVAPFNCAALIAELHPNPVPFNQVNALVAALHVLIAIAAIVAPLPVGFPRIVFAPIVARFASVIPFVVL
jgi:hypothetical protein